MPGSDASQFTRFKKANAVQKGDTQQSDPKSVNRLTQYIPRLSAASDRNEFLPSLTKSGGGSIPFPAPTPFTLGTPVIGTFTKDVYNGFPLISDVNYKLFRLNVDANITYNTKLTCFSGDTDIDVFVSYPNAGFTKTQLDSIATAGWSEAGFNGAMYVLNYGVSGGGEIINFTPSESGYVDIFVFSYEKGGWELHITAIPLTYADIYVDLGGTTFISDPPGGGTIIQKKYTITSSNSIKIRFINAGSAADITHIQFDTYDSDNGGALTSADHFSITNPTYGPAGTFQTVSGRQIIYDNNIFYGMTYLSEILLETSNFLSVININLQ